MNTFSLSSEAFHPLTPLMLSNPVQGRQGAVPLPALNVGSPPSHARQSRSPGARYFPLGHQGVVVGTAEGEEEADGVATVLGDAVVEDDMVPRVEAVRVCVGLGEGVRDASMLRVACSVMRVRVAEDVMLSAPEAGRVGEEEAEEVAE